MESFLALVGVDATTWSCLQQSGVEADALDSNPKRLAMLLEFSALIGPTHQACRIQFRAESRMACSGFHADDACSRSTSTQFKLEKMSKAAAASGVASGRFSGLFESRKTIDNIFLHRPSGIRPDEMAVFCEEGVIAIVKNAMGRQGRIVARSALLLRRGRAAELVHAWGAAGWRQDARRRTCSHLAPNSLADATIVPSTILLANKL